MQAMIGLQEGRQLVPVLTSPSCHLRASRHHPPEAARHWKGGTTPIAAVIIHSSSIAAPDGILVCASSGMQDILHLSRCKDFSPA